MKRISILFILSSLFLAMSCQDAKKQDQLAAISKMEKQVNEIKTTNDKKFDRSIGQIVSSVMDVEFRIRRNYFSDTIDNALAQKVNEYKMIRKKLKPVGKMFNQVNKGTAEEMISLKNLKSDIENGAGDASKYDENIKFEQGKVIQLQTILDEMIKSQSDCLNTYNRMHQEMLDFSNDLVAKNNLKKKKNK